MDLKRSPQNGGPKRIGKDQVSQYLGQTLGQQVKDRVQLEQEGDIAQKKKKGLTKEILKYVGPVLGTGATAGIPFLF